MPPTWSLDRRIPVWSVAVFVFTCLGAGAGAAMATGVITERVDGLEERARLWAEDHDRLLRMEGDLKAVRAIVERLEEER